MPLLLVRHASAGDRLEWHGDDRERPLDDRGLRQAETLVVRLAHFRIDRILTSPHRRCIQTVAPLAAARETAPEVRAELTEEGQLTDGFALVRGFAGADVVICGHGGLEQVVPGAPRWKKGATLVLGERLELLDVLQV